jgi:hypothetical protein
MRFPSSILYIFIVCPVHVLCPDRCIILDLFASVMLVKSAHTYFEAQFVLFICILLFIQVWQVQNGLLILFCILFCKRENSQFLFQSHVWSFASILNKGKTVVLRSLIAYVPYKSLKIITCKITISHLRLCECEAWSLPLLAERGLSLLQARLAEEVIWVWEMWVGKVAQLNSSSFVPFTWDF